MKLKLENQDAVTILQVTETIEAAHLPVLKAGLTKLFQSGKKTILLDFSTITEKDIQDPSLILQISGLRAWAAQAGAQVAVVGTLSKIAHAATRADAIKLFTTAPAVAAAGTPEEQEAALNAELKLLEEKKAALEKKLGSGTADTDLKKLRQQNSLLKKNIASAEKVARKYLKHRTKEPTPPGAHQPKQQELEGLVDMFLTNEGVLK